MKAAARAASAKQPLTMKTPRQPMASAMMPESAAADRDLSSFDGHDLGDQGKRDRESAAGDDA
jgi:hypothetical protein